MKPFRRFLYFLEYLLLKVLVFFVNLLSVYQAAWLAKWIGIFLARHLLKKRRQGIVLENLQIAFKDQKSPEEIQRIVEGSYQNLVQIAFEFVRIPQIIRTKEIKWKLVGVENCWKALEQKRGVAYVVSHFGNWELMGFATASAGLPLHAIARPVKNPYAYAYVKRVRMLAGFPSVDKDGAARKTIKLLKQNQIVAIVIDQHERRGAVWVDFFGRKASTSSLPALLALKYDTPIIPTFFYRERPDFFIQTYGEPFKTIRTGNYEADIVANTQQYVTAIENEIRKRPEGWLWMHRRWREVN